jgi:hypothetical protein
MFQILEFTEAHVASVTNRTESHGDEKVPAVSIGLELTAANTILDQIDPKLREALYKAVDGQDQLPGVEPATPVLRCNSIDRAVLPTSHEGWTLQVDDGIDESEPMTFGSVKVDKFSVEPKQGGSIVLRLRCGTSDISAETLGKLGMHNGQSIWVTLKAPERKPDAIDASSSATDLPPEADAGSLFAQEHGEGPDEDGEGGDSEGGEPDADGADDLLGEAQSIVIVSGHASISGIQRELRIGYHRAARLLEALEKQGVVSAMDVAGRRTVLSVAPASTRTARGREKTKAALADGLKGVH